MNDNYEFTEAENATVGHAAQWSTALAVAMAFASLGALTFDYGMALVNGLVAVALAYSGSRLRGVVHTEGEDIDLFLDAIEATGRAFLLRIAATLGIGLLTMLGYLTIYRVTG